MKKYVVELTEEERRQLLELTRKGECRARRYKRAMALLCADEGDTDETISERVRIHAVTVERIRRRFVQDGLEAALSERPRPGKSRKLSGRQEARLIALACTQPPEGSKRWTMRLLADRFVELGEVGSISDETVRRALKRGA